MGRIIAVTSGKGGVGKTTCCGNIALRLAELGKHVLAMDCDFGLRNLDLVLHMTDQMVYTLEDCLTGEMSLIQTVLPVRKGLDFLPAPFSLTTQVPQQCWEALLYQARQDYDMILMDTAAGLSGQVQQVLASCDETLIVTTPDECAVRDADRTVQQAQTCGCEEIALLINRVRPKYLARGVGMNVDEVMDSLGVPLIGIVVEDPALWQQGGQAPKGSTAAQCFSNIARRMCGEQVPVIQLERPGFFERLFRH